jgi:Holliday junction resolvase RusA-like endonuclease
MIFHFKPPESASKKRKIEMLAGKEIPTKKDCTNMQKLYEDCLKKIVVNDDRNVAKISSEKLYAEKDEVIIKVWTLKEYNEDCNRAS